MNKKEFMKELHSLSMEKSSINRKIRLLKHEYIRSLPYRVGDFVRIKDYGEGWLASITVDSCLGLLSVQVFPKRKDGKPSKKYRCLWYMHAEDITKIT